MEKIIEFLVKNIDKVLHAFVSMVVMLFVTALLSLLLNFWLSSALGAVLTMSVGIGKEIYDEEHREYHSAEWGDLLADFIGIILGFIPLLIIQL